MFEKWLGQKEKAIQLLNHDDGTFEFRQVEIEDATMLEKKDEEVYKAWPHFYGLQYPFYGYKNISAGMVSICFDRDIIVDEFNILADSEKPAKGNSLVKDWITKKAESRRYKMQNKPTNMLLLDKISIFLGSAIIIQLLIIGLAVGLGR